MTPEIKISAETIAILQYLLPGFLAAWVIYGITSQKKPGQFEQIIQALILALIVRVTIIFEQALLLHLGREKNFGPWSDNVELTYSALTAMVLGAGWAIALNKDWFYGFLRLLEVSSKTGFPSEWYQAFNANRGYITLHLKDERRLMGWPLIWPSTPTEGHFVLEVPHWVGTDGVAVKVIGVTGLMISAEEVRLVEFVPRPPDEGDSDGDDTPTTAYKPVSEG